jgi:hypothetical protein
MHAEFDDVPSPCIGCGTMTRSLECYDCLVERLTIQGRASTSPLPVLSDPAGTGSDGPEVLSPSAGDGPAPGPTSSDADYAWSYDR